jgi:DNA-binding CsgD family transcriptional regulator/tetratricopeptide (TPR) repeat protein
LASVNGARPSDVIGREECGRDLERMVDNLRAGLGGAVVLFGEPGIGKTTLLSAMTVYAKALDLHVVPAGGGSGPQRWQRLPDELARPAARGGALLVVDDLHRLPDRLAGGLDALVARAAAGPVLLAAAHRPRQLPVAVAAALFRAGSAGTLRSHPIGPLAPDDARRMFGERPDLAALHRDGHGNPAYMRALAAASPDTSDAAGAFAAELAELSPAERQVARLAAALGDPFLPELLAAVATTAPARTLAALDALVARDLVRPVEPAPRLAFRHPVVAGAVYARIPVSQRRAIHGRVEAELGRRGGPVTRRAFHIVRAADPAAPAHADTLLAAARAAIDADPRAAIEWLTAALTLIPEPDERWCEAQLLLARARLLTGRPAGSRAALHRLLAREPAPPERVTTAALVLSSEVERLLGNYREADAFAQAAAAAARGGAGTDARLYEELAEHAIESLRFDAAARHAATGARYARRDNDRAREVRALSLAALARFSHGRPADAEAAIAQAGRRADATSDAMLLRDLSCLYELAHVELLLERLADAERHARRGLELCRHSGQAHVLPGILKTLGHIQLRLGRLAGGLETLDEAAHLARAADDRPSRALIAALRANAFVWLCGGTDTAAAMTAAEEAMAACGRLDTAFTVVVRGLVAETLVQAGEPERGAHLTLHAAGGRELPRLAGWQRPRYWDLLVDVEHRAGRGHGTADRYAQLATVHVGRWPSPVRRGYAERAAARSHGLLGRPDRAVEAGEAALDSFAAGEARLDAGRTLLVIANACLDNRVRDGVAGHLHDAAEVATACGSTRLGEQVTAARQRLGGPDRPPPAGLARLTARESEVAELAGTGLTNGQIAARLRLSVRTVDSHLWRVYHKLGVPNRAGLASLLARGR